MTYLAAVLSILAGLVHVAIFMAESVWWRRPAVWRAFTLKSQAAADESAFFAFNQGFYNLFLAVGAIVGAICLLAGASTVGWALYVFSCASMVAAALVLRLRGGADFTRAAIIQLSMPLPALVVSMVALS